MAQEQISPIDLLVYKLTSIGYEIGPGQNIDVRPHGDVPATHIHLDLNDMGGNDYHALLAYLRIEARRLGLAERGWDQETSFWLPDAIDDHTD